MLCELDAIARNELASMAYARWSMAYDNYKKTKQLTWEQNKQVCPKSDWSSFHSQMIQSAEKELELASKVKDQICKYSPLICGE